MSVSWQATLRLEFERHIAWIELNADLSALRASLENSNKFDWTSSLTVFSRDTQHQLLHAQAQPFFDIPDDSSYSHAGSSPTSGLTYAGEHTAVIS